MVAGDKLKVWHTHTRQAASRVQRLVEYALGWLKPSSTSYTSIILIIIILFILLIFNITFTATIAFLTQSFTTSITQCEVKVDLQRSKAVPTSYIYSCHHTYDKQRH